MWGQYVCFLTPTKAQHKFPVDVSKSRLWLHLLHSLKGSKTARNASDLFLQSWPLHLWSQCKSLLSRSPRCPGEAFQLLMGVAKALQSSHVDVGKDAKYIYQTLCQAGESFYTHSWYPAEQLLLCYCMHGFLKTRFVSSHESCCVSDQKSAMFSGAWRAFPSVPERFYKLDMFPQNSSHALLTRLTLRFLISRSNNLCSSGCLVWRPLSWSFQRRQRYVSASGTWGVKRALTL